MVVKTLYDNSQCVNIDVANQNIVTSVLLCHALLSWRTLCISNLMGYKGVSTFRCDDAGITRNVYVKPNEL